MSKLKLKDQYNDVFRVETTDKHKLLVVTDYNNEGVLLDKEQTEQLILFLINNLEHLK